MIIENLKKSGRKVEEFYMGNKGTDINVGIIEEDIEIVKSLIEDTKKSLISNTELSQYRKSNRTIAYKATEHLLTDYERQKQINEEHQKINGELREKVKELEKNIEKISKSSSNNEQLIEKLNSGETFTINQLAFIKKNFIPKQKIKDKIEELIIQGNYKTFYNQNSRTHFLKEESDYKIEILQELLQESEDK